jgi:NAD(P)H-dependent FMN reductase
MASPRILVFAGALRSGAHSVQLAGAATKELARMDVPASRISLADYPLPIYDADHETRSAAPAAARQLHDMMLAHRGVYIATPEINGSLPPLLKNAVDWVSSVRSAKSPFRHCVFAIGSAAADRRGELALSALRQVLEQGLGALVIPEQVALYDADRMFDQAGDIADETLARQLRSSIRRLVTLANADLSL